MSAIRNIIFAVGFAAVGAVSMVGVQAVAGEVGGHHGRGWGHGDRLERLVTELNLDEAQQAQVTDLQEQLEAHHEELRGPERMAALLQQDAIDRESVHAEIDTQVAFMHEVADSLLDLHESLDADQRATLQEKAARLQALREHHGR